MQTQAEGFHQAAVHELNGNSLDDAKADAPLAELRRLRLVAKWSIAVAGIAIAGVGFFVVHSWLAIAPLADPYQMVLNENKDFVRLDRRTGEYVLIEDGVPTMCCYAVPDGNAMVRGMKYSVPLLEDKFYKWDKTTDDSQMEARLKYTVKEARCSVRVTPSAACWQRFQKKGENPDFVKVVFYNWDGVELFRTAMFWSQWERVSDGGKEMVEWKSHDKCSPAVFQEIRTCRAWYRCSSCVA